MTGPVIVRSERPGEESLVRSVVEGAFGRPVVGELVDTLRRSPDWIDGLSFVAELDGRIVGHVLFTRGLLDAPARLVPVLVLSPLGVATDYHGRGVGSALVRHGLEAAAARAEPLVFLEGDPRYYHRFGFVEAEPLGFRRPSLRIPTPGFQVVQLPSHEPWMIGTVVYPRAFWDLDCVGPRNGGAGA